MSTFSFNPEAGAGAIHQAQIPRGIQSKTAILDAISVSLHFPDYFGGNWDALWECICDLSWLPPGDIVLNHDDVPLSEDPASLSTYLSLLKAAVEKWAATGSNLIFVSSEKLAAPGACKLLLNRRLIVTFPAEAESIIRSLLPDACTLPQDPEQW